MEITRVYVFLAVHSAYIFEGNKSTRTNIETKDQSHNQNKEQKHVKHITETIIVIIDWWPEMVASKLGHE